MRRESHRRGKIAVAPVVDSQALQSALLDHFSCSCVSRDRDHCAARPTCPCIDVSLPGLAVTAAERRACRPLLRGGHPRRIVASTKSRGRWRPTFPKRRGSERFWVASLLRCIGERCCESTKKRTA